MGSFKAIRQTFHSLSVLVIGVVLAGAAWAWDIVDLGTLGGTESDATAINNSGDVVGYSYLSGGASHHAFLYTSGVMNDLGTMGGNLSLATDINDSGQIVGASYLTLNGGWHAFLYQSGVMTDITSSYNYGVAEGINNNGRIVGTVIPNTSGTPFRGFIYNNGSMTILNTFGGLNAAAQAGFAYGINNNNQVVGYADVSWLNDAYSGYHAFLYSGGAMTDIHASPANQIFNAAYDVNDDGTVVGAHWGISSPQLAFTYSNGVLTDIGTLPGGTYSIARAINSSGDVVGRSKGRGFLYSGGVMQDLNSVLPENSGWVITDAVDINDYGQIVGNGVINGENHAYILTPGC